MLFGEVIQLQDTDEIKDYVYLGAPPEGGLVFLARIPDVITSQEIVKLQGKLLTGVQSQRAKQRLNSDLYFIVELTTEEFKDRVVMLTSSDYDEKEMQKYRETIQSLQDTDIKQIKDKIMSASSGSVSPKLKKIVESLAE